jgi:hypothetical protein
MIPASRYFDIRVIIVVEGGGGGGGLDVGLGFCHVNTAGRSHMINSNHRNTLVSMTERHISAVTLRILF